MMFNPETRDKIESAIEIVFSAVCGVILLGWIAGVDFAALMGVG
jgi:hypothetical protein